MDDLDLYDLQLLKQRESNAWDELYRSTCRRTYRILHHVTGAGQLVLEELNQEVWLTALEAFDRFDASRGTPQDWILGIARFKGLTHLRRQYQRRSMFVGNLPDVCDRNSALAEQELAERNALLKASIESLPENWQYVLKQKYEECMSTAEIAALAGVSLKSIESMLSRARHRARQMFMETMQQSLES